MGEAAEVNPNVDVGSEDTKEVKAGEVVTFDDVESVMESQDEAPDDALSDKEEKPVNNEDQEEKPDDDDEPGKDDQEGKKEDPDDEEASPESAPDEEKVAVRTVKTKYEGKEHELYGDMEIPTKVAGKMEQPTLTELQTNYSGKINWDRKNNELHQERVQLNKEKDTHLQEVRELSSMVNRMMEGSKEDPFKFFDVIAEVMEADPVKLKMEAIKGQIKQVEHLVRMGDDDRDLYLKKLENKFEREHLDSQKRLRKQEDETRQTQSRKEELKTEFKISDDDYEQAYEQAKKVAGDNAHKINPDDVVYMNRYLMACDAVNEAAKDWVESLDANNDADVRNYNSYVNQLHQGALNNPGWTKDDLIDMVKGSLGENSSDKSVDNLGRKVRKTQPNPQNSLTRSKKTEPKVLTSFDDLD